MKKAEFIYKLMNDLLRYLLKYSKIKKFTEEDVKQALEESSRICGTYKKAPEGIGYLAYQMCAVINSYFMQIDKRSRE